MSANPTRIDWDAASSADSGLPLQAGNCVLQAIASQETMGALLAFSDLHRQIRERHLSAGRDGDGDLFETERFILDEVLQLICDRVQAITQADGIVVALPNESKPGTSVNRAINRAPHRSEGRSEGGSEMVCRAASGPLGIKRGVHLIGESEFLQDCLEAGSILRCDDCQIDTRVELDFSHAVGARSTVLVPLR